MGRFLFYFMFPHDFPFSNYTKDKKLLSGRVMVSVATFTSDGV